MIIVDPLFSTAPFTKPSTPRCFRNAQASHMQSTLAGVEGTRELIAFARRLGLLPRWIQRTGEVGEHFDLTAAKRVLAIRLGALEVSREECMRFEREKRA